MPQAMLFDVLLRGLAIGAFAATALALAAGRPLTLARAFGTLFFAAAIGHTLDNCFALRTIDGPLRIISHLLSTTGAVLFWAFAVALFTDRPRPAWRLAWPAGVMLTLALIGPRLPLEAHRALVMISNLFSAGFVVLALALIARGWRGDLVDARRRLRAPVMGAAAAYVLLMAVGDLMRPFGAGPMLGSLPQALALAVLGLLGVSALLRVDPVLLEAIVPTEPVAAPRAAHWLRLTGQAILLRRTGDTVGSEAALKALIGDDAGVTLYQQAQVYAQWGQADRALSTLETAYKARDSGIVLMKADPMVDSLRKDPRFVRLLTELGLA